MMIKAFLEGLDPKRRKQLVLGGGAVALGLLALVFLAPGSPTLPEGTQRIWIRPLIDSSVPVTEGDCSPTQAILEALGRMPGFFVSPNLPPLTTDDPDPRTASGARQLEEMGVQLAVGFSHPQSGEGPFTLELYQPPRSAIAWLGTESVTVPKGLCPAADRLTQLLLDHLQRLGETFVVGPLVRDPEAEKRVKQAFDSTPVPLRGGDRPLPMEIQVEATLVPEHAQETLAVLQARGFQPHLAKHPDSRNRTWHFVRMGWFSTPAAGMPSLREFMTRTGLPAVLVQAGGPLSAPVPPEGPGTIAMTALEAGESQPTGQELPPPDPEADTDAVVVESPAPSPTSKVSAQAVKPPAPAKPSPPPPAKKKPAPEETYAESLGEVPPENAEEPMADPEAEGRPAAGKAKANPAAKTKPAQVQAKPVPRVKAATLTAKAKPAPLVKKKPMQKVKTKPVAKAKPVQKVKTKPVAKAKPVQKVKTKPITKAKPTTATIRKSIKPGPARSGGSPAAGQQAPGSQVFEVLVEASQNRDNSELAIDRLRTLGYRPYLRRYTDEQGRQWNSVRIGLFRGRAAAESAQNELRRRYGKSGSLFVFPTSN
ncbi:MAG: SPOR domain-containing protein [Magnetococcales bacterium]|nr:SPOR domain-containing protein [Magnetococcales bacterium]